MEILITGGSGFLGINLVRHILERNLGSIRVLDIVDFDYPERDKITFIKGDVRDEKTVAESMKGVNWVVHAAAALPLYNKKDIFSIDIDGTRNLVEEAQKNNVERFVHISTTAVYGVPEHHPIMEDDSLIGVGPYGKAKIDAERVCLDYGKKGLCVSILRPKSFIGPERLGVFSILYEWASDGRNFPMIGSGKNRYQLLDVEDLCDAIVLCLTKNEKAVKGTFNIGAREFGTMKEDFQSVLDRAGFDKKIIPFPASPVILALKLLRLLRVSPLYGWVYATASKDSIVSIEKAERVLGFKPKYSNRDALIRNYEWYLKNRRHFENKSGVTHRVPWSQGVLRIVKMFF